MSSVSVERVPVKALGLGRLGFDHLQIVFETGFQSLKSPQDGWFVIEGLREPGADGIVLGVEGWDGGTTLSEANGGLTGDALADEIGLSPARGARTIAAGPGSIEAWATLVSYAADIAEQRFPYIAASLAGSPLPTINSSSLVASLLHHAGIAVENALPFGTQLTPGIRTLLGTSRDDTLTVGDGFTTLVGGAGDDVLAGGDDPNQTDKLYGGRGNDVIRWSHGNNIVHGGQPGLPYDQDGTDTADYSGAGELRIEVAPHSAHHATPHVTPDFIVTHASGQDFLFSIEEIIWDASRDRVVLGRGVGLGPAATLPEAAAFDAANETGPAAGAGRVPAQLSPDAPSLPNEPLSPDEGGHASDGTPGPLSRIDPGPDVDRDMAADITLADLGALIDLALPPLSGAPFDPEIDELLDPTAIVPAADMMILSLT
ncbi:hypothetical protein [Hyphomicrobium sp.]|uniref:hypothetical protein n=1 Tax=Hyphomicrobium sp. TaxID=82 RepID=UPI003F71E275